MNKTKYVLMLVFSPDCQHVIGITKLKGPPFLIGKFTFPGGKIEPGESTVAAASREILEETGVAVPESAWLRVAFFESDTSEMTIFTAVSPNVFTASTCEEEPVWIFAVARQLEYAQQLPDQYTDDFVRNIQASLRALSNSDKDGIIVV